MQITSCFKQILYIKLLSLMHFDNQFLKLGAVTEMHTLKGSSHG